MTFLRYYIISNVYILFFWTIFYFILRKENCFRELRIYLISSVILSVLLPLSFLFPDINSAVSAYNPIKIVISDDISFNNINHINETVRPEKIPLDKICGYLIIAGYIILSLFYLIKNLKRNLLLRKAGFKEYQGLKLITLPDDFTPFLFHKYVVLPDSLLDHEKDIVIEHEYQHFILRHHIDNIFMQLFQTLFWINPFIYLIIRDLRQIHEYQVDNEFLKSDIDVSIYQLTLIKFSVGSHKFAVANGLSDSRIKNRIIMMNKNKTTQRKWKFLLLIPSFLIVFTSLNFTQQDKKQIDSKNHSNYSLRDESLLNQYYFQDTIWTDNNNVNSIRVLINMESRILIENSIRSIDEVQEAVSSAFIKSMPEKFDLASENLLPSGYSETKIVVQSDRGTKQEDYNKLLETLNLSIKDLHGYYSNKIFGKPYDSLDIEEKRKILRLIDPVIYKVKPMVVSK